MTELTHEQMLEIYENTSQNEYEELEAMYELFISGENIQRSEIERLLSFYILKTYLLENNLIGNQ